MKQIPNLETKIREAKTEDFSKMKCISKKAFTGYDQKSIDLQIGEYFKDPEKYNTWKKKDTFEKKVPLSQTYFVAENQEEMLGYAGIERPNIDGDALGAFWLNWTAIHPKYQGKNLGKQLLIECIKQAKKRGATTLSVKTDSHSESAHKMYEKFGFKQTGRITNYYGKEWDLVLYSLDLESTDLRKYK